MAVPIRTEAVVQEGGTIGRERAAQRGVHLLRPQRMAAAVFRGQCSDDCESSRQTVLSPQIVNRYNYRVEKMLTVSWLSTQRYESGGVEKLCLKFARMDI